MKKLNKEEILCFRSFIRSKHLSKEFDMWRVDWYKSKKQQKL